jgi:hypothetical protein
MAEHEHEKTEFAIENWIRMVEISEKCRKTTSQILLFFPLGNTRPGCPKKDSVKNVTYGGFLQYHP